MKLLVTIVISLFAHPPFLFTPPTRKRVGRQLCAVSRQSGAADTKMGKQLNAKDLTDPKVQAAFSDAKATQSIKDGVKENGKTTMKAFGGKLTDDEIKALVAYVRTLKK
jgi:cytochrome c553